MAKQFVVVISQFGSSFDPFITQQVYGPFSEEEAEEFHKTCANEDNAEIRSLYKTREERQEDLSELYRLYKRERAHG